MKRVITALSFLIIAFALFSNFDTRAKEAKKKEKEEIKIEDVYALGTPIKIEDLPESMIKVFGKSCTNFICRTKKATGIMAKSFSRGESYNGRHPDNMIKAMAYGCAILALNTVFNKEMLNNDSYGIYFEKNQTAIRQQINYAAKFG